MLGFKGISEMRRSRSPAIEACYLQGAQLSETEAIICRARFAVEKALGRVE